MVMAHSRPSWAGGGLLHAGSVQTPLRQHSALLHILGSGHATGKLVMQARSFARELVKQCGATGGFGLGQPFHLFDSVAVCGV